MRLLLLFSLKNSLQYPTLSPTTPQVGSRVQTRKPSRLGREGLGGAPLVWAVEAAR